MKKFILLSALLFSIVFKKNTQAQTIIPCPADSINAWLTKNHVPAVAIGIIEDGKIRSIKTYGELKKDTPAPLNALWNVASLTKPVTAITVLSLVNKGLWNLEEPISKYYTDPDIKDDPRTAKLTTRILLSHSSGFPNWRNNDKSKKLNFHFEPGTQFGYSGEGYEYIRKAIEAKFHKPLQQIAREDLFIPAEMTSTRYSWDNSLDSNLYATPHNDKGTPYNNTKATRVIAADWLITTINDYCKFGQYVIKQAGLSQKLFDDMTAIQTHFDTTAAAKTTGMGLGWQVLRDLPNNEYALVHSGSDDGVKTFILVLPKSKRGIIIFTNGENGVKVETSILKGAKIDIEADLSKFIREFR